MSTDNLVCVADFEKRASEILAKNDFNYYKTAANYEFTAKDNLDAFNRYRLLPRMLRDVSSIDLQSTILGHHVDMPIGVSPMAIQKMAHPDGEIANAKAAASMGSVFTMSLYSSTKIEEVAEATGDSFKLLQLYIPSDNSEQITTDVVRKAEKCGFKGIVLTVDTPILGLRYENLRNGFKMAPHLKVEILQEVLQNVDLNDITAFVQSKRLTWEDVRWLKSITHLPVIVKGILSPADAALAAECGVAAVWVSNHGGRQLDTVPATIDVLAAVVRAVSGRCEVYLDGGVRCGTDILKALALGANAVFIGRPAIYGLACDGEAGVKKVLDILKNELRIALALSGSTSVRNIDRELVIHESEYSSRL